MAYLTATGARERTPHEATLQPMHVHTYEQDGETPATWRRYGSTQPVTLLIGLGGFGPREPVAIPAWQDGGPVQYVGAFDSDGKLLVWYWQRRAPSPGDTMHIPLDWTVSST